jgi:hypothetical protein
MLARAQMSSNTVFRVGRVSPSTVDQIAPVVGRGLLTRWPTFYSCAGWRPPICSCTLCRNCWGWAIITKDSGVPPVPWMTTEP